MNFNYRFEDPIETHRVVMDGRQASMWTALPGIVTSYNPVTMTASVQPAVQARVVAPEATNVNLPLLPDVPVSFPKGGPYHMTFPIKPGDECLLVFSSRCIDNWWQHGGVQAQRDLRMHDLSDAIALVGPYSQGGKLANVSPNTMQIRTDDHKLMIEFDKENMMTRVVTNDVTIDIDGNGGTVVVTSPTQVTVNSPMTLMKGDLHVNGAISAGVGTGDQIGLQTHRHTQPADSKGDTERITDPPSSNT